MDVQIPREFRAFVALSERLEKFSPTRVQVNTSTWKMLTAIITDPGLPWAYSEKLPIFGIPLAGVEIVEEVPDGIIRLPDITEESE